MEFLILKNSVVVAGISLFIFLVLQISIVKSQSAESLYEDGNKYYHRSQFSQAQNAYEQAIALDGGRKFLQAKFNLANALFQQKKYDEATKQFQSFIEQSTTDSWKEQAYYNLGNTFLAVKDYSSAINSFKQSLRINPKDEDARYNLALAIELSGGRTNKSSNTSTQSNQTSMPQTRPLTEEEKKQLLNHLSELENKTIQGLEKKPSPSKKSKKDW